MKLAILEADILHDSLQDDYVGYGRMFKDLLRQSGLDWELTIYPVISGKYPASPEHYDAFLITGSKYDSFADDERIVQLRQYAQSLYQLGKPVVGICFGHQVLAHALGGRAARSDGGWGVGVMHYNLESHPPFVDQREAVSLIASHRDQVVALPPEAVRLLTNDFCQNAGFYIPGKVLAIQPHPEFRVEYAQALLDLREDQFEPETIEEVQSSFVRPHDGDLVGGWIRRFLEKAVTIHSGNGSRE